MACHSESCDEACATRLRRAQDENYPFVHGTRAVCKHMAWPSVTRPLRNQTAGPPAGYRGACAAVTLISFTGDPEEHAPCQGKRATEEVEVLPCREKAELLSPMREATFP